MEQEFNLSKEIDLLWKSAIFLRGTRTRPNWSGYMSEMCRGPYPGKSSISLLPIIDLSPSDLSCIYSTLLFIIEQSKCLNMKTPVITFDQPLWIKATEVKHAKQLDVVLILGGFHLMMSFIGSVGTLMKGSGISEALHTVYGSNAVEHMLSGKAVSRALKGHLLLSSALSSMLLSDLFPSRSHRIKIIQHEEENENIEVDDIG